MGDLFALSIYRHLTESALWRKPTSLYRCGAGAASPAETRSRASSVSNLDLPKSSLSVPSASVVEKDHASTPFEGPCLNEPEIVPQRGTQRNPVLGVVGQPVYVEHGLPASGNTWIYSQTKFFDQPQTDEFLD